MPQPDPPEPAALTELEWLALLPSRPPREVPLPWKSAPVPPDPAAAARRADPLTAERLLALLSLGPSAALCRLEAFRLAFGRAYGRWTFPHYVAKSGVQLSLLAIPFAASAAGPIVFSGRDLGIATAALLVQYCAWWASVIYTGILSRRQVAADLGDAGDGGIGDDDDKRVKGSRVEEAAGDPQTFDASELAQTARWLQLVAAGDGNLLVHDSRDPQCPCSRPSCLGREPSRVAVLGPLQTAFFTLFTVVGYIFFAFYTVYVTLASYTWHHVWSAVLAGLFLLIGATFNGLTPISSRTTSKNLALIAVEARLQHRAFAVALASLVDQLTDAVDGVVGRGDLPDGNPSQTFANPEKGLHVTLYRALAPVFRLRFHAYLTARTAFLIAISIELTVALIYVAGSSCLPAFSLTTILGFLIMTLLDLIHVARANAHVDSIIAMHLAARAHIRMLLLRLGPRAPALQGELLNQERVLSSALDEAARLRATFAGVPVTIGVVRTVAATVLTIGVGLFGILKGMGVYVTLDSVCGASIVSSGARG
ncbi:hypothetical protein DFJ74DRAFT_112296 [Hyaloraphidium curvatum]|nr:hypothetical protein DFJ74DRAFT_112296 [Hyaloraphidium curvatum]